MAHLRIDIQLFILIFQILNDSYLIEAPITRSYGMRLKFELIRDTMVVLVTAKNKDLIKLKAQEC